MQVVTFPNVSLLGVSHKLLPIRATVNGNILSKLRLSGLPLSAKLLVQEQMLGDQGRVWTTGRQMRASN
jgi:hypothetical protein